MNSNKVLREKLRTDRTSAPHLNRFKKGPYFLRINHSRNFTTARNAHNSAISI